VPDIGGSAQAAVIYRSSTLRRVILRDLAFRADRITATRALEFIDDGIGCAVLSDLCAAEWLIEYLEPPPCPITIVWGEKETLLPPGVLDRVERIPHASVIVLPDVGHVPMVDDPRLVARTILARTGAIAGDY
jgi:pimeloyl-ACP methyl ester carboxylesterase